MIQNNVYVCTRYSIYAIARICHSNTVRPYVCHTRDTAKVTVNGLYNVVQLVHGLSIAAKMYDLEWPLSEIQGHWFLKCCKNDKIRLSNESDAMYRVAGCIISIRPTYSAPVHLLTYAVGCGRIKTGNISKTVEDRAKVTIKVVHALSIAAKMYDLKWPLSQIQGHSFFNPSTGAKKAIHLRAWGHFWPHSNCKVFRFK